MVPSIEVHTKKPAVHLLIMKMIQMMIAMSEMVTMMGMMMVMMATTMAPSIEVQTKKTGGPPVPENKKFTGGLQEVHTGPIDVHVQRESVYMSACASKCPLWIDVSVTPWLTGQC